MELSAVIYCYSEPISDDDRRRPIATAKQALHDTVGFKVVNESLSTPSRDAFTTRQIMPKTLTALLGVLAFCRRVREGERISR
jgi:hypothetical protein